MLAGIALVGALLGAAIGLVGTLVATRGSTASQNMLQVRQLKEAEYSTTYQEIALEDDSFTKVGDDLARGDTSSATKEVHNYTGGDALTKQLASLPLIASGQVLKVGLDYLHMRDDYLNQSEIVSRSVRRWWTAGCSRPRVLTPKAGGGARGRLLAAQRNAPRLEHPLALTLGSRLGGVETRSDGRSYVFLMR
jgi:hypothetical protein